MLKGIKLIELYCTVRRYYDSVLAVKAQRMSNNGPPVFTGVECITIYIFGLSQSLFSAKTIYDFIKDFFPGWFPRLPSYQAFNHRICFLSGVFQEFCCLLISRHRPALGSTFQLDSLPITVAQAKRSGKAMAAPGLCVKSYRAFQDRRYYGVKLPVLGQKIYQALPRMMMAQVTPADEHDIGAAKEMLPFVHTITLFADKACYDLSWSEELKKQGIRIYTPVKLGKGQMFPRSADRYFSEPVSKVRQAIESFFNYFRQTCRCCLPLIRINSA